MLAQWLEILVPFAEYKIHFDFLLSNFPIFIERDYFQLGYRFRVDICNASYRLRRLIIFQINKSNARDVVGV